MHLFLSKSYTPWDSYWPYNWKFSCFAEKICGWTWEAPRNIFRQKYKFYRSKQWKKENDVLNCIWWNNAQIFLRPELIVWKFNPLSALSLWRTLGGENEANKESIEKKKVNWFYLTKFFSLLLPKSSYARIQDLVAVQWSKWLDFSDTLQLGILSFK